MPYGAVGVNWMLVGADERREVEQSPVPLPSLRSIAREQTLCSSPHLWIIARPGPATPDAEEAAQHSHDVCIQHSFSLPKSLRAYCTSNIAPDAGQRHECLLARRHGPAVVPYQSCGNAPQTVCPIV